MMLKNLCISIIFLLAMMLPINASAETPPPGSLTVEARDGRISVKAEDASFKDVLKVIAEKSGIKVKILDSVQDKKVTLEVKDLPLYAISSLMDRMEI